MVSNTYFLYEFHGLWYYTETQGSTNRAVTYKEVVQTGQSVYAGQELFLTDRHTDAMYYGLFSDTSILGSMQTAGGTLDYAKVREQIKSATYWRENAGITVADYSAGSACYLYLFEMKGNLSPTVKEYRFTMIDKLDVRPGVASGSEVFDGTTLTYSMKSPSFAATELRIYQVGSEQDLDTLRTVDYETYTIAAHGDRLSGSVKLHRNYTDGEDLTNQTYLYIQAVQVVRDSQGQPRTVYASEVVELQYSFADRGEVPVATPTTITIDSDSEDASGSYVVEAGGNVQLSTDGDAVIVYFLSQTDRSSFQVQVVTDAELLLTLDKVSASSYTASNGILYVKNNGLWYETIAGAKIYNSRTGIVLENNTNATISYYLSAVALINGSEPSARVVYAYQVEQVEQAAAPTAVLSTTEGEPTRVPYGSSLFFQSLTPDVEMYYTTDGTTPGTKASGSTRKYNEEEGILVEGSYNDRFYVHIVAIRRNSSGEVTARVSGEAIYVYLITDQNQAKTPTATPTTDLNAPVELAPGDKILLSSGTKDAAIYYTTDNEDPDITITGSGSKMKIKVKKGTLYDATKGIVMPEGDTEYFNLKAVAVKTGLAVSEVAQFRYSYPAKTQIPYATPSSGVVDIGTEVALKNASENAVIYYEIAYGNQKPANPTLSSAVYDSAQSFVINQKTTIKAIAVENRVKSEIATFVYTTSNKLGVPQASLDSGSIVARSTSLSLTAEGTIYYTTDGSDPTDSSNTAVTSGNEIILDGEYGSVITIKAYTEKSGYSTSDVTTLTYQISQYQGGVTSSLATGAEVNQGTTVNLISDVTNAVIYYTTDGSTPMVGGTSGTTVTLGQSAATMVTVKALAVPGNMASGSAGNTTAIFTYKIKASIPAPTASPSGGELSTAINVELAAAQGSIHYTTDGTTPSAASPLYEQAITVNKSMTIRAVAVTEAGESSAVASFIYTTANRAISPTATKESARIEPETVIYLTTATPDAKIYYTTDGTTPTLNNLDTLLEYDEAGITISRTITLQAVAYKDGMQLSRVASYNYEVTTIPAAEERKKAEEEATSTELKETDASGLSKRRVDSTISDGIVIEEKENNTNVVAEEGTFPEGTKLVTRETTSTQDIQDNLQTVLGENFEILKLYDMKLYSNGALVQPEAQVEIGIPIPDEYANAAVQVVYVDEDNQIHSCETTRSGNVAYAKTDHFSLYALAGVAKTDHKGFTIEITYIVAGATVLVVIAGISFVILQISRRRRAKKNGDS